MSHSCLIGLFVSISVLLPAAGKSQRFGDAHYKKPFIPLDGRPVWLHSAEKFVNRNDVKQVIVIVAAEDREDFVSRFGGNLTLLGIELVEGGSERFESVENGLKAVADECELVAIHDAARPCIAESWIDRVFADAKKHGAAILASPVSGTLKRACSEKPTIEQTVSRENIWEAQTPQVFRKDWLLEAFEQRDGRHVTDEAQLLELAGREIHLTSGSPMNIKLTTKQDLKLAELILRALPKSNPLNPTHPFEDNDLWR